MYIWEQPDWPRFRWDEAALKPRLDAMRLLQGRLLGQADAVPSDAELMEAEMDALIQNAIRTSEIEGEHLDAGSVRSSVARQLGLDRAGIPRGTVRTDALVGMLVEATRHQEQDLALDRLCRWQAALFPNGSGFVAEIRIGELRGEQPMQVVSGRLDKPRVHFEAPPRKGLEAELDAFLAWFNHPPVNLDPLLRAGVAHLWFETLHPFDDGNGRVGRAVTDRALAQAEGRSVRFYSLSAAFMARRNEYYAALENAQRGELDITPWLEWFLDALQTALEQALDCIARILAKKKFWQRHATTLLNERQVKLLNRLLDNAGEEFTDGISARKYQSMTGVSKATATRDLTDMMEKGCLMQLPGGGRSTRYALPGTPVTQTRALR